MDKFVSKWKKPVSSSSSNVDLNDKDSGKRQRVEVELTEYDIVGDPGLRKPIDDYPFAIRDELRRRYLAKGPFQPHDHNFPKSSFGKNMRSFQKAWFTQYDWLEYSIQKDAAFCQCSSFRDQRHNVDYVLSQKGTETEIDYRVRLTAVVKVVRLLLGGGLPFRGHDESKDSIRKGHFLEILDWYCEENEEVKKVMNLNAPGNNQLTSSKIQKEIINACATEHYNDLVQRIQSGEISTGTGLNQETSLARPGATRWGSHYRTIKRMLEMWDAVQDVLDTIESEATDFQSRGVARGLIAKSTTFEFVFIAYLLVTILDKTSVLSAALQEKSQNIGKAFVLIRTLKEDLGSLGRMVGRNFLKVSRNFVLKKAFWCLIWKIIYRVGLGLKDKWMTNQRLICIFFDETFFFR
ncbi:TTF-type zinc finger protein with HAT dimerisation domain [Striga hermonthica]|uniref:TTF-type zinc finger protein with HAT dimerisation domain n=1 Tax=Striga hermonthica TaxID=68872 RepID=A0A9N7NZ60_STRHE|nr:TTF-type zinc finger protein with HAT dimerisation domain [Striga hermonthica]